VTLEGLMSSSMHYELMVKRSLGWWLSIFLSKFRLCIVVACLRHIQNYQERQLPTMNVKKTYGTSYLPICYISWTALGKSRDSRRRKLFFVLLLIKILGATRKRKEFHICPTILLDPQIIPLSAANFAMKIVAA
jgi:hypothetical protein